jgi:hypothetical protein
LANGFSTFKEKHHYTTGILLVVVGGTGLIGSLTGELGNMLAALFMPSILYTAGGTQNNPQPNPGPLATGGTSLFGILGGPSASAPGGISGVLNFGANSIAGIPKQLKQWLSDIIP